MDTLAKRILDALSKYHKEFTKGRILKTTEEVEANTNPENVASALVTGELINNLGGNILTYEDGEFYIQAGADTASKKRLGKTKLSGSFQLTFNHYTGKTASSFLINGVSGNILTVTNTAIGLNGSNQPGCSFYVDVDGQRKVSVTSAGTRTVNVKGASSIRIGIVQIADIAGVYCTGSYSIE